MAERDADRDEGGQPQSQRDAAWGEPGKVGDDRRRAGGAADRDGDREVDQQGSEGDERPAVAVRGGDGAGPSTALGKSADQLVVGGGDDCDGAYD